LSVQRDREFKQAASRGLNLVNKRLSAGGFPSADDCRYSAIEQT